MLNHVAIEGRLSHDPELKKTGSGASVTNFRIVSEKPFKSDTGDKVDYISCVAWNKLADNICKYCNTKTLVCIEGRLTSRSYDNAQGQKVYVMEVLCDKIHFLGSNKKQTKENSSTQEETQQQENYEEAIQNFDISSEDIQF